jgi:hypothetical protein
VLLLRVLAIVILVVIIACMVLGAQLSKKLWYLAGIMFIAMLLVLFCSFFRFDRMRSRYVYRYGCMPNDPPRRSGQHSDDSKASYLGANNASSSTSMNSANMSNSMGTHATTTSEMHRSIQDSLFSGAQV